SSAPARSPYPLRVYEIVGAASFLPGRPLSDCSPLTHAEARRPGRPRTPAGLRGIRAGREGPASAGAAVRAGAAAAAEVRAGPVSAAVRREAAAGTVASPAAEADPPPAAECPESEWPEPAMDPTRVAATGSIPVGRSRRGPGWRRLCLWRSRQP